VDFQRDFGTTVELKGKHALYFLHTQVPPMLKVCFATLQKDLVMT
jgi:hypothetical protein